jgi:hypothetical protein
VTSSCTWAPICLHSRAFRSSSPASDTRPCGTSRSCPPTGRSTAWRRRCAARPARTASTPASASARKAPCSSTPELLARQAALEAFARRNRSSGYLVGDGLEGGRRATPLQVKRLSGRDEDGIPRGLRRCARCGAFRGDYLAVRGEGNGDRTPRVVPVHCRCENHNRCARCGEPLAEWRLSSYFFAEADRAVRYLAAYAGLGHRCVP